MPRVHRQKLPARLEAPGTARRTTAENRLAPLTTLPPWPAAHAGRSGHCRQFRRQRGGSRPGCECRFPGYRLAAASPCPRAAPVPAVSAASPVTAQQPRPPVPAVSAASPLSVRQPRPPVLERFPPGLSVPFAFPRLPPALAAQRPAPAGLSVPLPGYHPPAAPSEQLPRAFRCP